MVSINYKDNAFDFIRLFAAAQVAVLHTVEILGLGISDSLFIRLLYFFPGVPVFFFVSGFLISRAFERSPGYLSFANNRALRIFPGLWVCIIINLLLVATTGYFVVKNVGMHDVFLLAVAKSTILQFYNPDFMRDFGDGVLNGSLWTITVELQFYFLAPILYKVFISRAKNKNLVLVLLIAFFIACNRLLHLLQDDYSESVIWKLFRVSFAPWFYMFLFGVILQRNFARVSGLIVRVPFIVHLVIFCVFVFFSHKASWSFGNSLNPFVFFALSVFIFKVAYTDFFKMISGFLKGNDLSYGIYIFHMPLLNQFVYLNYETGTFEVIMLFLSYLTVAVASWFLVERPSLKLKKHSVRA